MNNCKGLRRQPYFLSITSLDLKNNYIFRTHKPKLKKERTQNPSQQTVSKNSSSLVLNLQNHALKDARTRVNNCKLFLDFSLIENKKKQECNTKHTTQNFLHSGNAIDTLRIHLLYHFIFR